MCKNYSTFGLFNMYCSSLYFFFSQSSICALSSIAFLHCSYNIFHCSSKVPFCVFFFFFEFWTIAIVPSDTVAIYFFFFSVFSLYFFSFDIYCYTDITNFTIFSQLLRYQFLISQNKIIKCETVTNHNWNKCFVKMLWHLLGERVKATILLVCSSGTVATVATDFFFSLVFCLYF